MATGDTVKNRLARANEQLRKGQFKEALQQFQNAQQTDPDNKEIRSLKEKLNFLKKEDDVINRYMENKLHKNALGHIDIILSEVNECARVKLLKAECLAHLNEYGKAEDLMKEIGDSQESKVATMDMTYIRSLIQFNQGDIKKALDIAAEGMKMDKSHPKVKQIFFRAKYFQSQLEEAEKAVENKNYQAAQIVYTEVGDTIIEDNKTGEYNKVLAKILKRKVETSLKMRAYIDAIADCERIISYGEFLDEAYAYLADAHVATGGMDIAVKVLKKSLENKNLDEQTRSKITSKLNEIESKKVDQPLRNLQETLKKYKSCKTFREVANVDANTAAHVAESNLTKLLAKYSPDQYANKPESHKFVAAEIFEFLQQAREKLSRENAANAKLQELKDTFQRMNSSKTPRQAVGMKDDASKKEVEIAFKQLIKKYHPDGFGHTQPEDKHMAEEIIKKVRDFQDQLKREKQ